MKNKNRKSRKARIRQIKIGLRLLLILLLCLAFSMYRYLSIRPGWVETETMKATERTNTSITVDWEKARNSARYEFFYKEKGSSEYTRIDTVDSCVTMDGLKEGSRYIVYIKAFTDDGVEGIPSYKRTFKTKMKQNFGGRDSYLKLTCSKDFNIAKGAKTDIECRSSDKKVATVDEKGNVHIKKAGKTTLTIKAKESPDYMPTTKKVKLEVIGASPKNARGAKMSVIGTIGPKDLTTVMRVAGADGAVVPQSMAFAEDRYIVVFGMSGKQRVVSYKLNGNGRKVYVPSHNLGHPNGFTYDYETGLCYCLRGNTTSVDTFDPKTGKFGKTRMTYQAAGICYDRVEKELYTTSRTGVRQYTADGKFKHKKLIYNISHPMFLYTQDSGAHAGYVFRCMSGRKKHSENYIDIYRVKDSKYIGSLKVTGLGELESAVVGKDGYLELLVNSSAEYIYRTKIRPEDLD